jgi:hypothetical protein
LAVISTAYKTFIYTKSTPKPRRGMQKLKINDKKRKKKYNLQFKALFNCQLYAFKSSLF